MLLILIIFIALVLMLEFPGLIRSRAYPDIIIVALLLLLSTAYGIAYDLNSDILPNPNRILFSLDHLADSFQSLLQLGDDLQR